MFFVFFLKKNVYHKVSVDELVLALSCELFDIVSLKERHVSIGQ